MKTNLAFLSVVLILAVGLVCGWDKRVASALRNPRSEIVAPTPVTIIVIATPTPGPTPEWTPAVIDWSKITIVATPASLSPTPSPAPTPTPTPSPTPHAIEWATATVQDGGLRTIELGLRDDHFVVWRVQVIPTPTPPPPAPESIVPFQP